MNELGHIPIPEWNGNRNMILVRQTTTIGISESHFDSTA